jgi:death-on-curing protein
MKTVTLNDILLFHKKIIKETGGSEGVRDIRLIDSSLNRALQTFDGIELHQGIIEKISVITYSLIKNHGFVDGNKRIGIATMLLILRLNIIKIGYSQKELVQLGFGIADGSIDEKGIKNWIEQHRVL